MTHTLSEVKMEWMRIGGKGDFSSYLNRWYRAVYDTTNNFIGYTRNEV